MIYLINNTSVSEYKFFTQLRNMLTNKAASDPSITNGMPQGDWVPYTTGQMIEEALDAFANGLPQADFMLVGDSTNTIFTIADDLQSDPQTEEDESK